MRNDGQAATGERLLGRGCDTDPAIAIVKRYLQDFERQAVSRSECFGAPEQVIEMGDGFAHARYALMKRVDRKGITSLHGSGRRQRMRQIGVVRRPKARQNQKAVAEDFLKSAAVEIDKNLRRDTGISEGALNFSDLRKAPGSFFRNGLSLEHEGRAIVVTVGGSGNRNGGGNTELNEREHRFAKRLE
jgi:hypothetical protein